MFDKNGNYINSYDKEINIKKHSKSDFNSTKIGEMSNKIIFFIII